MIIQVLCFAHLILLQNSNGALADFAKKPKDCSMQPFGV